MADKKDDPGKDQSRSGESAAPKKPVVTLDLTAKEVKEQPSTPATGTAKGATSTGASGSTWSNLASKTDGSTTAPAGTAPPASGATATGAAAAATAAAGAAKAAASAAKDARDAASATPKPTIGATGSQATGTATTGTPTTGSKAPGSQATGSGASTGSGGQGRGTPPPAAPPPPRSGGGFGRLLTHMLAGIIGGFLALLGADTLAPHLKQLGISGGLLGGQSSEALTQRMADVEKRLAARPAAANDAGAGAKLAEAERRLAELEQRTKALDTVSATAAKLAADTKALEQKIAQQPAGGSDTRLTKLEQTLAALAAAADSDPQKGRIPQLAALSGRIKDLETSLDTKLAGLQATINQSIEARIGQTAEAAEAARSGTQRIDRELTGVRTETAKITQRIEALKSDADRLGQTLRVVQEETGGLKSGLDAMKGDLEAKLKSVARPADVTAAVAPVAQKLASLESSVQGVVRSESDRRQNAQRIVLSLELNNLKRVLDRGQKYAAELAEVKSASGGRFDLAALEAYKDKGVPTLPELMRDFRPIAGRILDASLEPEDGTVLERLMAGAKSIVRVRRTDHAPGDTSTEAIIGRIETALKENRLGDVVGEAKALSAEGRTIAKDWLARVEARQTVDRALSAIEGQLKSSLSGAPAPAPKSN